MNPDDFDFIKEVHGSESLGKNLLSLKDKLKEAIQDLAKKQRNNLNNKLKPISKEMLRTANLELLFNALGAISPTSV